MVAEDPERDVRRMRRRSDRLYPANRSHAPRWVWAVALPLLVVIVLAGVFVYQRIYGGKSVDPLTLNSRARDVVILLPVPDGWTRTDVVTTCPGEPDGCAGGGFRTVGTTSTEWLSPEVAKATTREDAAEAACQDLSAQLLERSSAPPLRAADCVPFLTSRSGKQADEAVIAWKDESGEWAVFAIPRAELPTGDDPKRFGFAVQYLPTV